MKIDLELIRILDAIDKQGSFEAAANELHKVRSAVTYQIQKYEELLDIQIF
jgi:DNA-binding transcriptional LysR family regulator